jgi:hypothetical protein
MCTIQRIHGRPAHCDGVGKSVSARRKCWRGALWAGKWLVVLAMVAMIAALGDAQQNTGAGESRAAARRANLPPRVAAAERFLAQRGWNHDSTGSGRQAWAGAGRLRRSANATAVQTQAQAQAQGTATWQPLGPAAVQSQNFGLVTGRISALALDPSDTTGNTLYVGTTGGGVWRSQNANSSSPANITFTALTDDLSALSGAADASISIGALTVQPGGTGVIWPGPATPTMLSTPTMAREFCAHRRREHLEPDLHRTSLAASQDFSFAGEGFAGFAWSTVNPQLVVAAVSQAYEGTLVNANRPGTSYEGCTTPPIAEPPGRWPPSRTAPGQTCRGQTICLRFPMGMRPHRWCGTRYGNCLWRRCATTATTSPRTASPGRGWRAARLRPGGFGGALSHQSRRHGLARLPHLSRNAGGESADRRHLCLDGGRVQPGPGNSGRTSAR